MHRGYIKIWRKIEDSGLFQLPETLALFMFILTRATHKPIRIGMVNLERGQYCSGRIRLAFELEQSERKIRTGLDRLQELEILTIKTTSKYSVYTIVNYNNYQDVDTTNDQQNDQQATNERPASDQQATTKQEHKNIINKEQYSPEFVKFWETWPSTPRKAAKVNCWKVWKNRKLNDIGETIIAHVKYCKGNGVWKDEQYIPAPLVYLNGSRWDGAEIKSNPIQSEFGVYK